jgi:hypothetical protein
VNETKERTKGKETQAMKRERKQRKGNKRKKMGNQKILFKLFII